MKKTIAGILGSLALVTVVVADEPVATVIRLCDNVTELILPGIRPGRPVAREEGVQIAQAFMGEWRRQNPGSNWIMAAYDGPRNLAFQVKSAAPTQAKQGGMDSQQWGAALERIRGYLGWKGSHSSSKSPPCGFNSAEFQALEKHAEQLKAALG